jgi:hypothetical protein
MRAIHRARSLNRHSLAGEERTLFNLHLLGHQQCPSLVVLTLLVELDLVGNTGSKPGAANDADFSAVQRQLGYVGGESDKIIYMRLPHGFLLEPTH